MTTRRPDLSEMGGYVSALGTDHQGRNVQGALNVPIIKDVLAVRVAGVIDENDNGGVRSIHNALRPYSKSTGERVSVSFEPSDAFNANVAYQHLDHTQAGFVQVAGPGFGVNPPISARQRAAVADQPSSYRQRLDRVTAVINSRVFGQHLSYVGAYNTFKLKSYTTADAANVLPFADPAQLVLTTTEGTTQEIRLASDPAPGRFFDYTVGAFYSWASARADVTQPAIFLGGAFGPPDLPPNTAAFNPAFQVPVVINGPRSVQETSLFGTLTLHLGAKTELSGGIRHIINIGQSNLLIGTGNGLIALPASILGGSCGTFASTYPGSCDLPLQTAGVVSNTAFRNSDRPNIYNVSLSHHLTRDVLVYANTGTS